VSDRSKTGSPQYGLGRGQVFPAENARSLLNPLRRLVQSPKRTVAALGIQPGSNVLEVGPGPGFFTPMLSDAAGPGCVVLIDLQFEMVDLARQRTTAAGKRNVAVSQGDAAVLPFAAATFDTALVATVLGELPQPDRLVGELARVLRAGGIVGVAETRRDSDFIRVTDLVEMFTRGGFEFVRRSGSRLQYVATFRRPMTSTP